ncbi:MAG: hypothetical protein NT069_32995, partial [Planctomycetota bacterium]|nr:hypothetical protein [Planctomycetota bacterium]
MVTSSFDPNDPRLTAWLLGELPASEREEFEQYLNTHPEARAEIELLRGACDQMRSALVSEPSPALSDAERAGVLAAAERPPLEAGEPATISPVSTALHPKRWHSLIAVATTIAGCALVIALVNQTPKEPDTSAVDQRNRFTSLERRPESFAPQSSHEVREVAAHTSTRELEQAR